MFPHKKLELLAHLVGFPGSLFQMDRLLLTLTDLETLLTCLSLQFDLVDLSVSTV
ncbi:hypothetical protein DPEC_G00108060 [Dallia pectoralis]|uniref:Uncharacterized protein n=1 Tax=Dallia pectoralis TaxID=75939 RepID=A0ACC2GSS0_DALPE|nr:hypothetical protein DPEC_G00108060 [Dallia pectoralis]